MPIITANYAGTLVLGENTVPVDYDLQGVEISSKKRIEKVTEWGVKAIQSASDKHIQPKKIKVTTYDDKHNVTCLNVQLMFLSVENLSFLKKLETSVKNKFPKIVQSVDVSSTESLTVIDVQTTYVPNPKRVKYIKESQSSGKSDPYFEYVGRLDGFKIGGVLVEYFDKLDDTLYSNMMYEPWITEVMEVMSSNVSYKGNGFGFELYVRCVEEATKQHSLLIPNEAGTGETSEDARRIWDFLYNKFQKVGSGVYDPDSVP